MEMHLTSKKSEEQGQEAYNELQHTQNYNVLFIFKYENMFSNN